MKKILSLLLAIVMMFSAFSVTVFAADAWADSDYSSTDTISFDVSTTGWRNYNKIYCHVWAYDGSGEWPLWQSKAERCDYNEYTGIATYDLSKTGNNIGYDKYYLVIFSADTGMQTYNLLFNASCIGKTAYCDGTEYENPEDSSKTAQAAFWRGVDPAKFGPVKCVTSIGNVVGTCVPPTTSSMTMFEDFLEDTLSNARTYARNPNGTPKTDQQIIDDTASALGLSKELVIEAIAHTGVEVDWSARKSYLPSDGTNPIVPVVPTEPVQRPSVPPAETKTGCFYIDIKDSIPYVKYVDSVTVIDHNGDYIMCHKVTGTLWKVDLELNGVKLKVGSTYPFECFYSYDYTQIVGPLPDLAMFYFNITTQNLGQTLYIDTLQWKNSADIPEAVFGDTDLDGEMSILDATEIQLVMASLKPWKSDDAMAVADVDGDGDISVLDATEIQMIIAGLK